MIKVFIVVLAFVFAVTCAPPTARIRSLPGFDGNLLEMYSGYMTVDQEAGRNLFYWFVKSPNASATTPLLLWMNGGPGCSSLYGFWTEHGPYQIKSDGKTVIENPYTWVNAAHMIYLEAPAGVGFSYSLDGNYTTGDDAVAADNYRFLLAFFDTYPEMRSAPFFVSGESYAGHYVPQLALQVVHGNAKGNPPINLQGVLAGNPSTDFATEANNKLPFMAMHGFASLEQVAEVETLCGTPYYPPRSQACADYLNSLYMLWRNLDPYNVYKWCGMSGPDPQGGCLTDTMALMNLAPATHGGQRLAPQWDRPMGQTSIPCNDPRPQIEYMSDPAVLAALHVSSHSLAWEPCSSVVQYRQYAPTMIPVYQELIKTVRVLIYSGDVDSCVPYLGTEKCVAQIGAPLQEAWRAWNITDPIWNRPQTAGYTCSYGSALRYATVKGSGHMVPTDQPLAALEMVRRFLTGQPL